jgi:hypothetical protein
MPRERRGRRLPRGKAAPGEKKGGGIAWTPPPSVRTKMSAYSVVTVIFLG